MLVRFLLPLVVLALPASAGASDPESAHIHGVAYDLGADRPVANATLEFVGYANCDSDEEIFRASVQTEKDGEFQASLPVGSHGLRISAQDLKSMRGCIPIAATADIERCSRMPAPFGQQSLILRTASPSSKFPADILSNHPCAQVEASVCSALSLPNKILSKRVVLMDEEQHPVANVKLEFHAYSMGPGELFGSVITDSQGGADLAPIYAQEEAKGYKALMNYVTLGGRFWFQLDLSPEPDQPLQIVRLVKWRCHGEDELQAVPDQPSSTEAR